MEKLIFFGTYPIWETILFWVLSFFGGFFFMKYLKKVKKGNIGYLPILGTVGSVVSMLWFFAIGLITHQWLPLIIAIFLLVGGIFCGHLHEKKWKNISATTIAVVGFVLILLCLIALVVIIWNF